MLSTVVSSFTYQPKTTSAQVGGALALVLVPTNDVPNNIKEGYLDLIGWTIANIVLSQISASIVNWINSGFEGSPAFVTDFKGFLTNIADEELGNFIQGSELSFLCSPFAFNIKLSLALQTPFKKRVSCTLTKVVGNVDRFIDGKFSEGGWEGWFELTTKRQNNPYGAYLLASAELNARTLRSQNRELFKVDQGDGFLSFETCLVKNSNGDCVSSQINLPGKVIESQLNNTLAGGQQRLNVADEFDEIVVALFAQLVQKVLFEGLLGASSGSGGSSSYTSRLANPDTSVELEKAREGALKEVNRLIAIEEAYKKTKESTLNTVIQEEQQLLQLKSCYQSSGGGNPASIDTIIQNQIEPLKESLNADITDAQVVSDGLNLIKIKITDTSILNELADLVNELRRIGVHSVIDAQNEQIETSIQLNSLNTQQKLRACQLNSN